jgi:hypothetical protein
MALLFANSIHGDGWLSYGDACYGSTLGSNPDISQKYKMGDISKGVDNTLKPAKKYKKNFFTVDSIVT